MKTASPFVLDLTVPIGLHLSEANRMEELAPIVPICLAEVPARLTLTRGGRVRVSVRGQIILDQYGTELSGKVFTLRRVDRILGPALWRAAIHHLMIKPKKDPNE